MTSAAHEPHVLSKITTDLIRTPVCPKKPLHADIHCIVTIAHCFQSACLIDLHSEGHWSLMTSCHTQAATEDAARGDNPVAAGSALRQGQGSAVHRHHQHSGQRHCPPHRLRRPHQRWL